MATISNNDETNLSNSIIMDLENLSQEYNNLLIQYNQAVNDYVAYLQQQQANPQNNFVIIPNQSYYDSSYISQFDASSADICLASCSSTTGCGGATYDSSQNLCLLGSMNGNLISSPSNDYAIVPAGVQLLNTVEALNSQLLSVNNQIISTIQTGEELFSSQQTANSIGYDNLINNYQNLLNERAQIEAIMDEHSNLDQNQNLGSIATNQNYYSFLLLAAIVIVIIIIIVKISAPSVTTNIQTGGDLNKNAYFIVIGMFLAAILIYFIFIKK
jgi:hypothetical protein